LPEPGKYIFKLLIDDRDVYVKDSSYTGQILPTFSNVVITEAIEKIQITWDPITQVHNNGGYYVEIYDQSSGNRIYRRHLSSGNSWTILYPPLNNGQKYRIMLRAYLDLPGYNWGKTVAGTFFYDNIRTWNGDEPQENLYVFTLGDKDCFGLGGTCPDGSGLWSNLGWEFPPQCCSEGRSHATPDDPVFTDRWISGAVSYDHHFDLGEKCINSAKLLVRIAGIADTGSPSFQTPYNVYLDSKIVGQILENNSPNRGQETRTYVFDVNPTMLQGKSVAGITIPATSCADQSRCDGFVIDYSELRIITEDGVICPIVVGDNDGDGVRDDLDNCPSIYNPAQNNLCVDNFDDNIMNSQMWGYWSANGVTINETNRQLEIYLGPGTYADNRGAGYGSRNKLKGNFDIQVGYRVLIWPDLSGVRIGINVKDSSTDFGTVERVGFESPGSYPLEAYLTNFRDGYALWRSIETQDLWGNLRLVRIVTEDGHSIYKGYYFNYGINEWVLIHSRVWRNKKEDVNFSIGAWRTNAVYTPYEAEIALDNYVVK
jgi:hypothetical protein